MSDDLQIKNILNGLAEGMGKNADSIAKEEQLIRDAIQPLGRIVPEKEQESINTITASLVENIRQLRETAIRLRQKVYFVKEDFYDSILDFSDCISRRVCFNRLIVRPKLFTFT